MKGKQWPKTKLDYGLQPLSEQVIGNNSHSVTYTHTLSLRETSGESRRDVHSFTSATSPPWKRICVRVRTPIGRDAALRRSPPRAAGGTNNRAAQGIRRSWAAARGADIAAR